MVELTHKTLGSVGAQKKQETPKNQEPMTNDDLKSLIELGAIIDTVDIGGSVFKMRSLSSAERLSLASIADNDLVAGGNADNDLVAGGNAEQIFDFNTKLLAVAITSVNGTPLELLHPDGITGDPVTLKTDIIKSLQTPVINKLLEFYQTITDRCDSQFTAEQVKN